MRVLDQGAQDPVDREAQARKVGSGHEEVPGVRSSTGKGNRVFGQEKNFGNLFSRLLNCIKHTKHHFRHSAALLGFSKFIFFQLIFSVQPRTITENQLKISISKLDRDIHSI